MPPQKTLDEIVEFEDRAVAIAELLRDSSPNGLTREEVVNEFSQYADSNDVDRALEILLERAMIYTQYEDSTSRVVDALRAEGRNDLLARDEGAGSEQKTWTVISERIDADYKKTGGIVIVRYHCVADKKIREARDRSVVSRAVKDILILVGLENNVATKRTRANGSKPPALAGGT